MAPSKQQQQQQPAVPPYSKDERVLCFHHEMLYEAKILDVQPASDGDGWSYKIHYKGWKSSWDDWVSQDRIRKFTDENKDLASQLHQQFKLLQAGKAAAKQPVKKVGGRANGSDMSSARGSEERVAGTTATAGTGRGPRRARDYEIENVSMSVFLQLLRFGLIVWCGIHERLEFMGSPSVEHYPERHSQNVTPSLTPRLPPFVSCGFEQHMFWPPSCSGDGMNTAWPRVVWTSSPPAVSCTCSTRSDEVPLLFFRRIHKHPQPELGR